MNKNRIELIARAIIIDKNHLLLAKPMRKDRTYTFLPGGHIEHGESAAQALKRELHEELGITISSNDFVAVLENSWQDNSDKMHEINLIFNVYGHNLSANQTIPPCTEDQVEFLWQPLTKLNTVNLLPSPLIKEIPKWLKDNAHSVLLTLLMPR